MYSLSKGNTNNLLVKTRRGLSQNLDNLDTQQPSRKPSGQQEEVTSPKPVFNLSKKSHQQKSPHESITPQQEEMVKYINDTWTCVKQEYEMASVKGIDPNMSQCKVPKVCYYTNKSSSSMPNFEPFDLETFWGQRLFQNLTKSAHQ
ncbi:hypothetical protein HDE_02649 [Halotydeus destructor]|nr:hypothetical protein HDE_02649 [Halotydeus destructor]